MDLSKNKIIAIAAGVVVAVGVGAGVVLMNKGGKTDDSSSQSVIINAGDKNNDASAGEKVKTNDDLSLAQADTSVSPVSNDDSKADDNDTKEQKGSIIGEWKSDDGYYLSVTESNGILHASWLSADSSFEYNGLAETDNTSVLTIHLKYKSVNGEVAEITDDKPEDFKLTIVEYGENVDLAQITLKVKDPQGVEYTLYSYESLGVDSETQKEIDNNSDSDPGTDGGIDDNEAQGISQQEKDIDDQDNEKTDKEIEDKELDSNEEYDGGDSGNHSPEELEEMFG